MLSEKSVFAGFFLLSLCISQFSSPAHAATKAIRGFADFNFSLTDADDGRSQFRLGQYDTYITGSLTDKITYLSEVVFEYDEGWILDLERLWVRYKFNDALSVSTGKFHTALGFWNRNYHHGALLHTSVDRPIYLFFEDEGGILPIHTTGLLISGIDIGSSRIYYDVMVGNGLGSSPTEDNDSAKSISVYVHSKVIEDVDFGVSFYSDSVSEGAVIDAHAHGGDEALPLGEDVDQLIMSANVSVNKGNVELLTEFAQVTNKGQRTGTKGTTTGLYALGAYTFDDLTPFFKFDLLDPDDADPIFSPGKTTAFSVGVKYDLSYLAAVKVQYTNLDVEGADKENLLRTQLAIGF